MEETRTESCKRQISAPQGALIFLAALMLLSCSASTRTLFFDVPPPRPEAAETRGADSAAEAGGAASQGLQGSVQFLHPHDLETDRPPIEEVKDWAAALELLPKDYKGDADWVQALKDGVVMPRALDPRDRFGEAFKLDFYFPSEKPKFEAYFPHSAHVALMGCDSCHPAIFRYQDNEISMKSMRAGENCGKCHGNVAFSLKNCERCHTSM